MSVSMCRVSSELFSAAQEHEGSERQNTTYGGLIRFYLE